MGYEIDFLPVGEGKSQGDAIALRFGNISAERPEQTVVVIDGGYQDSGQAVVDHIKKHYGSSHVDLMVSSHPDADHINGLSVILDQMDVDRLWIHKPWNHTEDISDMFKSGRVTDKSVREALRKSLDAASDLVASAAKKGVVVEEPFEGLRDPSRCVTVVGPSEEFYTSLLPGFRETPEPLDALKSLWGGMKRAIGAVVGTALEGLGVETLGDGGSTSAENNSSAILLLEVDGHGMLFTGDAGIPAIERSLGYMKSVGPDPSSLQFVQVPHHGSPNNVSPALLNGLLGPILTTEQKLKTAFVSAPKPKDGESPDPRHPAKKVLNAFRRRGAHVCVTRGQSICHPSSDAPPRVGWGPVQPLPLYGTVEVFDDE